MRDTSGTQRRLTPAQKGAIVAAVASGLSKVQVASQFKVHPNTVSNLCKPVAQVENSPLNPASLSRQALSQKSYVAIDRSVEDVQDVHKAASTALGWLKGTGELVPDGGATVNVTLNLIRSLPRDIQDEYLITDIDATDVTPESSDPHQ